jgi:diguanylate cyclase (GGDEF)-like protein
VRRFGHPFSLLMIDIDRFKESQRQLRSRRGRRGHTSHQQSLARRHRGIDLAARIGGEEFAVLLVETSKEGGLKSPNDCENAIKALEIPAGAAYHGQFWGCGMSD